MNLTDSNSPIIPFTPLTIRDAGFNFDYDSSDLEPDDATTLTPLLRRIVGSPKLLTPKASPANATIINGRLAPPLQPQHRCKSPQRRGSPLAGFRRLRSPRTSAGLDNLPSIRLEVPKQSKFVVEDNINSHCLRNNNISSKVNSPAGNLAARRRCRQLRLKELQRRYAVPFEVHAVQKPLSPRVAYLLRRVGMIRYRSLFQMEEVDFMVFRTLSEQDLQVLGIGHSGDREEIFKAVLLADALISDFV